MVPTNGVEVGKHHNLSSRSSRARGGGHDQPEKVGNEEDCLFFIRSRCIQELGSQT